MSRLPLHPSLPAVSAAPEACVAVERWIGANVTRLRRERRLTQSQLAALAGIEVRSLQRIESGQGRPTARLVALLAAGLQIHPGRLFDEADMPERRRGRPPRTEQAPARPTTGGRVPARSKKDTAPAATPVGGD